MKLATVQMPVVDAMPVDNRTVLAGLLDATPDADLYLVPELWTCGYVQEQWGELADEDTPDTLTWMAEQSRQRRIWLGGSVIVRDQNGLHNRFMLFNRGGDVVMSYDKIHLFEPLGEHVWLQPGTSMPPVVDVEGIQVAPAICYDLRFPEMFRELAVLGVEVFLVVAEWPRPRGHALRIMCEARAIENQAYLVLSNRIGPDYAGNYYCGGSAVFGPERMLSELDSDTGVVIQEMDVVNMRALRSGFPVLEHRVLGVDY